MNKRKKIATLDSQILGPEIAVESKTHGIPKVAYMTRELTCAMFCIICGNIFEKKTGKGKYLQKCFKLHCLLVNHIDVNKRKRLIVLLCGSNFLSTF